MKTFIFILVAFLLSINAFSQPEVKGYKVNVPFRTTVITIVGQLYELNSETIDYKGINYCTGINAIAKDKSGLNRSDASELEIKNLVTAFENKYQIKFEYRYDSLHKSRFWEVKKEEYNYSIYVTSHNMINFSINNDELFQKLAKAGYNDNLREEQIKNKSLQNDL